MDAHLKLLKNLNIFDIFYIIILSRNIIYLIIKQKILIRKYYRFLCPFFLNLYTQNVYFYQPFCVSKMR